MVDILVVGTHPDDIEIGCGGSVARWVESGHNVAMLDLTNGEPTPFGDPQTRAKESAEAARILGVETRINLDLPNRTLQDTVEARRKVAEVYRKLRPKLVFIQVEEDAHPDHMASSNIAWKARFDAKLTKTDMAYEPWYPNKMIHYLSSHLKYIFEPAFILDVTDTFEKKLATVRAYKSQFAVAGREESMIKKIEVAGSYYGGLIGVKYGEPFLMKEPLGLSGLRDIIL